MSKLLRQAKGFREHQMHKDDAMAGEGKIGTFTPTAKQKKDRKTRDAAKTVMNQQTYS